MCKTAWLKYYLEYVQYISSKTFSKITYTWLNMAVTHYWAVVGGMMTVSGILGNSISILVLRRKMMRSQNLNSFSPGSGRYRSGSSFNASTPKMDWTCFSLWSLRYKWFYVQVFTISFIRICWYIVLELSADISRETHVCCPSTYKSCQ